ncbi:MAG TPA: PQQ-binding-like beta-propeller repeat protein [Verrucomicrobiales bacterium]|jgi:outer membrane protein assembly factor BamB|nr:PQQ-binding-like beta-propeller repeat protein [Verrucomicrobiales bacterium]
MKPFRILSFLTLAASLTFAADWPQWRGKDRQDHSPDASTLVPWPEKGPERLWLYEDAGVGYSGFSIVGDQLFTMGAWDGKEHVLCIDIKTGKKLWATPIDDRIYPNQWGDGPRSTPTIDGDRAYALSANGLLACLTIKDGKEVWKVDLVKDYGGKLQDWGYTESVLVDGDRVICTPGGPKGTMAAFLKADGKLAWQSKDLDDAAQYSSPILVEHGGKRQYVQLIGKRVFGAEAESGKILWEAPFPGRVAVIPTPIYHDGYVYVTAGYGVGSRLLKLDGAQPKVVYDGPKMVNHHGGVILVDGKLYGHSEKGGWTCQDFMTGEALWQDKKLGKGCCSFVAGHLVCVDENNGDVVLAQVSPEKWNEKSRFRLEPQTRLRKPQGRIWTHPVILDGRLYLRDQNYIYCYNVKAK